ncbi:DUF2934 domain-containing protein [Prosthecomicrobium pneumaticum]|uniref:DUF2934 domain-containing protein n=1 Tax=Prosthecomicrobium pneumaticum TaxID=81895 RepID=A0A7W9FLN9_9HYPH|nr:DUF2934 domain-containing protein [Prosthecomicrobium pneumaticum]MBB5752955.1 hypothetical protein [Prosthecomicrobium pneumaticum]
MTTENREERIRVRAYEIWVAEGMPAGREADHWYNAEREIAEAEQPAPAENGHAAAGELSAMPEMKGAAEGPRARTRSSRAKPAAAETAALTEGVAQPRPPRTTKRAAKPA